MHAKENDEVEVTFKPLYGFEYTPPVMKVFAEATEKLQEIVTAEHRTVKALLGAQK